MRHSTIVKLSDRRIVTSIWRGWLGLSGSARRIYLLFPHDQNLERKTGRGAIPVVHTPTLRIQVDVDGSGAAVLAFSFLQGDYSSADGGSGPLAGCSRNRRLPKDFEATIDQFSSVKKKHSECKPRVSCPLLARA